MRQPGDIVVIVPRWIVAAVGLLMVLVGLSGSFLILFAGYITEGILLSLFVLVAAPFQLLIMYILWRFYWYVIVLGILLAPLLSCASLTGLVRIAGITYARVGGSPVSSMGDNFALAVLLSILLAGVVVMVLALILRAFIGSPIPAPRIDYDVDELDRPRRKRPARRDLWKDDRPYPPPTDPYWDDK